MLGEPLQVRNSGPAIVIEAHLLPSSPQHRDDGRRPTCLDLADHFEPKTLVEVDVERVRGLEIGGFVGAITDFERMREQGRAVSLALTPRIHADRRQVPVLQRLEDARRTHHAIARSLLLERLSDEELDELARLLGKALEGSPYMALLEDHVRAAEE